MKSCFVITHIPNPRMNKRIEILCKCGDVSIICTRRKSQDLYEAVYNDVPHYIYDIDLPSSRHLIKRYLLSNRFRNKAIAKLRSISPDVIYTEGFDSLLIAHEYQKKYGDVKLIYEVADLREIFIEVPKSVTKRLVKYILGHLENRCIRQLSLLVLTSIKFYDVHYYKLISRDKVIYAPNVPDINVFKNYVKKSNGVFTVGFIGGIRYLKQMKMLVDAADEVGCNVLFAGAGGTSSDFEEIQNYCNEKQYVKFTGKYNYNTEIAKLYGMVDCVYAVYDADNPNVRIALPNKLYESIYCELPIVVAKGTYLSEIADMYGIGISVDHKSVTDLINCLVKLKTDKTLTAIIQTNCKRAIDVLMDNNWAVQLEKVIISIKETSIT